MYIVAATAGVFEYNVSPWKIREWLILFSLLNWQDFIKAKDSSFFTESQPTYLQLPIRERIRLLQTVFEWLFDEHEEEIMTVANEDPDEFRILSLGLDDEGCTYWYFPKAARLYKELPWDNAWDSEASELDTAFEDRHFRMICGASIEEWNHFMDALRSQTAEQSSEQENDTVIRNQIKKKSSITPSQLLLKRLEPVLEVVIPRLEAKEREMQRLRYLESLPRRQSNRIAVKQSEQDEIMRMEEQQRREMETLRIQQAEEERRQEEERLRREADERRVRVRIWKRIQNLRLKL